MTTAIEIKAGVELDFAVAEAIGLKEVALVAGGVLITPREFDALRGIEHPVCEGYVACIPFQPSADLNAAFAAAVKSRLFDSYHMARGKKWGIALMCDQPFTGEALLASAATPALAICAAILKLKEETT